jgi:hypothetical protein
MIRAASMPHLGQTTPTAALGLRAIRSLLTRLDATASLTVLSIPEMSATACLRAPVLEDASFLRGKSVFLLSFGKHARNRPTRSRSRPTFVDTTANQPTFPSDAHWSHLPVSRHYPTSLLVVYQQWTLLSETGDFKGASPEHDRYKHA